MKRPVLAFAVLTLLAALLLSGCSQEEAGLKTYAVDPGDAFVTNVKDSKRLLKTDIIVEVLDQKTATLLEEKNYLVRDVVNDILRSKTEEELSAADTQRMLNQEITAALGESLSTESVYSVYFNTLVIQ